MNASMSSHIEVQPAPVVPGDGCTREFGGREAENQPSGADIDVWEGQYVAPDCGLPGLGYVDDGVERR